MALVETPPSTTKSDPVIQRAIGDDRKITASATSLGDPALPSGTEFNHLLSPSGQRSSRFQSSISPGETEFTLMPKSAYSRAADLVNINKPALLVE